MHQYTKGDHHVAAKLQTERDNLSLFMAGSSMDLLANHSDGLQNADAVRLNNRSFR